MCELINVNLERTCLVEIPPPVALRCVAMNAMKEISVPARAWHRESVFARQGQEIYYEFTTRSKSLSFGLFLRIVTDSNGLPATQQPASTETPDAYPSQSQPQPKDAKSELDLAESSAAGSLSSLDAPQSHSASASQILSASEPRISSSAATTEKRRGKSPTREILKEPGCNYIEVRIYVLMLILVSCVCVIYLSLFVCVIYVSIIYSSVSSICLSSMRKCV